MKTSTALGFVLALGSQLAFAQVTASVTIKGGILREGTVGYVVWTLTGPSTTDTAVLFNDSTRTLLPGTYKVSVQYGEPFGTFDVDGSGNVVNPTGVLTASANVVEFDTTQLAKVTIPVENLSTDTAKGYLVIELAGIMNVHRGISPAYYLPANSPGNAYLVRTRGTQGTYGTFVVNPDLTLGATTGSLVAGEINPGGFHLDFDRTALTGIGIPSTADLTVPYGVGAFWSAIGEVAGFATFFGGGATVYLPANNSPGANYLLSTWGGTGRFGSFRIESDGSVSSVTGSLLLTETGPRLWQMAFDLTKMARIDLRIRSLVQPFPVSGIRFSLPNEIASWTPDQVVHLPPNAPGLKYQFQPILASSSSPAPSFGTLQVDSVLNLVTTGATSIGADGHTLNLDLCALNGLRIASSPSFHWSLGIAAGYYTRDLIDGNATDLFLPDGSYTVSFSPGGGSITATLAGGAITSATPGLSVLGGSVSVASCDSTPPVLSLPADITTEATSAAGAAVAFTATATDAVDPSPTVSCAPASGSTFPVGTTTVTCTATDASYNSSQASFSVTVQDTTDTTAPSLTLPPDVTTEATSAAGAAVTFVATATDAVDPSPTVSCSPASGSTFPVGTTTVTCTATDEAGNSASGTFTVQVIYAFDGFKPPIANDGSSIFKIGRTVPVKFELAAGSTAVGSATATIQVFRILSTVTGTEEIETAAAGASNTGNLFRYEGGQYIYNLQTTGYATGTYVIRAFVSDGTVHEVLVSMR